jgi:hypothetical protein
MKPSRNIPLKDRNWHTAIPVRSHNMQQGRGASRAYRLAPTVSACNRRSRFNRRYRVGEKLIYTRNIAPVHDRPVSTHWRRRRFFRGNVLEPHQHGMIAAIRHCFESWRSVRHTVPRSNHAHSPDAHWQVKRPCTRKQRSPISHRHAMITVSVRNKRIGVSAAGAEISNH